MGGFDESHLESDILFIFSDDRLVLGLFFCHVCIFDDLRFCAIRNFIAFSQLQYTPLAIRGERQDRRRDR